MISIEDLVRELIKLEQQMETSSQFIEGSKDEVVDAMNRAQRTFGDQLEGQQLIYSLSDALKNLIYADGSLHSFKVSLEDYIKQITK